MHAEAILVGHSFPWVLLSTELNAPLLTHSLVQLGRTGIGAGGAIRGLRLTVPPRAFVEMHLSRVRPECDRPESPSDDAEVRIGRGLKYPKDRGYAKFLAERGYDRNWAGLLAAKIVEEGRVRVETRRRGVEFVLALRRLANPRLEKEAFLTNAKAALEAMTGTQLTRGLLDELPALEALSFVPALRFCLTGDLSDRSEICRIAKAIYRRVAVSRGPRLTLASAAHEHFLESQSIFGSGAFTWSDKEGNYTDRLTRATREEFDDWDFSPRSARRRLRAKQGRGDSI